MGRNQERIEGTWAIVSVGRPNRSIEYQKQLLRDEVLGVARHAAVEIVEGVWNGEVELGLRIHGPFAQNLAEEIAYRHEQDAYINARDGLAVLHVASEGFKGGAIFTRMVDVDSEGDLADDYTQLASGARFRLLP